MPTQDVIRELAYLFRARRNNRPILILGAGASYRSGIPMAGEATKHIARAAYAKRILGIDEDIYSPPPSDWSPYLRQQAWFINDETKFADNFPLAVQHLLQPSEFRREFFTKMIVPPNEINPGYYALANIIRRKLCWTVLTVNFDHLIADAIRDNQSHISEIIEINRTADDLVRFKIHNRCQVVYLHGAVEFYRDKNLSDEIRRLDETLVRRIRPLLNDSPLVVIGYRGSEQSVMDHLLGEGLEESGKYRQGIYWCSLKGTELHENVIKLKEQIGGNFFHLEIDGFDELMEALDCELADEYWLPTSDSEQASKPLIESSKTAFDYQPMEGVSLEELDHDLILSTLTAYCKELKIPTVDSSTYTSMMQEQGLLLRRNDILVPSIGCYLLFGRDVQERFPYAKVAFTSGSKRRQVFEGNLIFQYRSLEAHLHSEIVNPLLRIKGERAAKEKFAYPSRALTEILVNMLVHRDYETDFYSYIEFEPGQSLCFSNPGGLMPNVYASVKPGKGGKFQPVRNTSELRNRSLGDIFFGLGPMDKDGSGLADVKELMVENGGLSDFNVVGENQSLQVTLWQPRQHAPDKSRVARGVIATELYTTNLLPFSVMPRTIYKLPLRKREVGDMPLFAFEEDELPRELPIFVTSGGYMFSFADLSLFPVFVNRRGDLGKLETLSVSNFISQGDDQHNQYVWLINKHWKFFLQKFGDKGLLVEDKRKRAFFTLLNREKNTIVYNSRHRKGVKREVVKKRGEGNYIWYENEGIAYTTVNFGGNWAIQVKPFYMFTKSDARTPLPSFLRSKRSTKRIKFDRNKNVDDDLSFWARLLSGGEPTINIGGIGVEHLIIDSEYSFEEVPLVGQGEKK